MLKAYSSSFVPLLSMRTECMSDIELGGRDINGRLSLLSCFPSSERGRLVNFVNLHSLCREELDLT